ncbi:LCP family protein [Candidatus Gracilibacteria bacterium]|nr:LCP family protein [Candidatus Gracilibacteria bacterium]
MDNRFRREQNLSQSSHKKTPVNKHTDTQKKDHENSSAFVQYFLDSYKKIRKHHVIRDSVLLALVLFSVLLTISWALPRVLSFHFDANSILGIFNQSSPSQDTEEEAGDVNILILGRGGRENDAPDLTDSIILGHYNKAENSFVTVSIPRDLLVQSKILGRVKINELYPGAKKALGEEAAMNHLLEMVSQITGKEIRLYGMIDFNGFRKLVDAVGGVDIEVPERLYDPEYPTKNWGYTIVDIPVGLQHFDGDKALKYSRSRHTTSDFDRSRRQQLVIQALKEKMTSLDVLSSPTKLEGIYTAVSDSVQTNMSLKDIFKMAKLAGKIDKQDIHSYALDVSCFDALRLCNPGGLIYSPGRELFGGLSVLLPKKASPTVIHTYDTIRLFVAIITQYPSLSKNPGIAVVNASGRTNLALSMALKLKSIGVPIDETQIKNQKEKVEKTFIRFNSSIIKPDNIVLNALTLGFSGEKRPATDVEKTTMISPYELVLGSDASTYFQ